MKRIPRSFQLGPHTIKVRIVTEKQMIAVLKRLGDYDPEEYTPQGFTIFDENLIFVRRVTRTFSKAMQMHAFWHEYFHILLERAGRPRIARDETLVDTLGGMQLQAFNSAQF